MKETLEIIYCYRDREPERVRDSLDSLAAQADEALKVTFIDYGSEEHLSKEVQEICKQHDFCSYFYVNARGKMWNRGDAINHGILLSKSEHLFIADIDLLFLEGFIATLHALKSQNQVSFFPVGYLTAAATKKARRGKAQSVNYKRSETFAAGMLLAARQAFNKVNGYNSFYSIWGLEDNDLKRRMERAGLKTQEISKVWMLHMYHAPVPGSIELPDGWIQFMKDHFKATEQQLLNRSGLTQCITLEGRPAQLQFNSGKLHFKEISGRKLYVRSVLLQELIKAGTHAFSIRPQLPVKNGFIQRNNKWITKFLHSVGLHAKLISTYGDQYISEQEIIGEICFVVKTLSERLVDYYIHSDKGRIQFVAVCR